VDIYNNYEDIKTKRKKISAVGTAAAVPVGRMTISLHVGGAISLLEIAPWAGSAIAAEAVPGGCEVPRVGPVGAAVSRAGGIPVGSAGSGGGRVPVGPGAAGRVPVGPGAAGRVPVGPGAAGGAPVGLADVCVVPVGPVAAESVMAGVSLPT
jgi:hypothetical protein